MRRLIALGVLALGLITGCTTIPTPTSLPSLAPQTTLAPTPAPSPAVVCQGDEADCAQAIELAREHAPADVVAADTIVVADICPPEMVCDRVWAFDSIVAFVRDRSLIAAYEVTGTRGPEVASRVVGPLSAHIEALIRGASATP